MHDADWGIPLTILEKLAQIDALHKRLANAAGRSPDDTALIATLCAMIAEKALEIVRDAKGIKIQNTVCGVHVTGGE